MALTRGTIQEITDSICNQVRSIMEIDCIVEAHIQIDLTEDSLPIVNAQIETYAPKK
jgi:hypothetical protein